MLANFGCLWQNYLTYIYLVFLENFSSDHRSHYCINELHFKPETYYCSIILETAFFWSKHVWTFLSFFSHSSLEKIFRDQHFSLLGEKNNPLSDSFVNIRFVLKVQKLQQRDKIPHLMVGDGLWSFTRSFVIFYIYRITDTSQSYEKIASAVEFEFP